MNAHHDPATGVGILMIAATVVVLVALALALVAAETAADTLRAVLG